MDEVDITPTDQAFIAWPRGKRTKVHAVCGHLTPGLR